MPCRQKQFLVILQLSLMAMIHALYAIFWILVLALALKRLPFFRNLPGLPYPTLLIFFLIKAIAGAAFILIYTYYYETATADIYRYFFEGRVIYEALWQNPADYLRLVTGIDANAPHLYEYYHKMHYWWDPRFFPVYNDNRLIIRYNALLNLLSFGKIYVNAVIANFLSLAGLVAFYKFALRHVAFQKLNWIKWGIFLFPSLIFWGSGLTKEVILIPALGFFFYYFDRIIYSEKLSIIQYVIFALLVTLLLLLKGYVLILLLPCLMAFILSVKIKKIGPGILFSLVIFSVIFMIFTISWLFPHFNPINILASHQNSIMQFSVLVNAGSIIHEVYLEPTIKSILLYSPRALFNVLFRPHLLESLNPVILLAALENMIIVLFILAMVFFAFKKKQLNNIEYLGIWFTLLLFVFIGLTTQVYGTLVRFKIPALPLLWLSFISIVPVEKLKWTRFFINFFERTSHFKTQ